MTRYCGRCNKPKGEHPVRAEPGSHDIWSCRDWISVTDYLEIKRLKASVESLRADLDVYRQRERAGSWKEVESR